MLSRLGIYACLVLLIFAGGWFVLRISAPVASGHERPEASVLPVETARGPARRSSERLEASETPEQLLERLAALTTPAARARSERERLARDRATYRALAAKPDRSEVETSIMRSIEEQSRYPTQNRRFALGRYDPVLRARAAEQRSTRSADGNLALMLYTDRKQYDLGATIQVSALLSAASGQALPASLDATLSNEQGAAIASLSLRAAAPGTYQAVIDLAAPGAANLQAGLYLVRARGPEGLSQTCAFTLRPAYARLTGNYRDSVASGALIVEVEVEVFDDGDYHALASLYTDDGFPVGVTEQTYTLARGTHWVALDYHGRLMHDAGRPGPYHLAHLQLAKLSFPVAEGVEAEPAYWTAAYSISDFGDAPYNPLAAADEDDEPL